MRFCVTFGNHGNGIHVEDIVANIRNALRTAGEEAYALPTLLSNGVNIVLECFTREQAEQVVALKRRTRCPLVIVVSEFTDGRTFNPHITSGDGHYVDRDLWQARFDNFMAVAAEADAFWCLSAYSVPQYRSLFPNKPVLEFPIGFDTQFPGILHAADDEKDIDVLFTGNETPYRNAVIQKIIEKGLNVVTAPVTTPTFARIDLIARSKATLHINLSENRTYTSPMRHHFLLMCQSPVLSEQAHFPGVLDDFVTLFPSANFVSGVCDYIGSDRWRQDGIRAHKRYRAEKPLAGPIKKLLSDSLG